MQPDKSDEEVVSATVETLEKPWYASTAIWGGLVAVASGVLAVRGISVGAAEQELAVQLLTAVASTVGGALAIYGRVKASRRIGQ